MSPLERAVITGPPVDASVDRSDPLACELRHFLFVPAHHNIGSGDQNGITFIATIAIAANVANNGRTDAFDVSTLPRGEHAPRGDLHPELLTEDRFGTGDYHPSQGVQG